MSGTALLDRLTAAGVRVRPDPEHGDRLRLAPPDRLTPELLELVKRNKPALLAALRERAPEPTYTRCLDCTKYTAPPPDTAFWCPLGAGASDRGAVGDLHRLHRQARHPAGSDRAAGTGGCTMSTVPYRLQAWKVINTEVNRKLAERLQPVTEALELIERAEADLRQCWPEAAGDALARARALLAAFLEKASR